MVTHVQGGSNGGISSSSTITVDLVGITAGNALAVWVAWEDSDASLTVSDGTSTFAAGTKSNNGGAWGQWHYLLNANAGDKTITANYGASKPYRGMIVHEFSSSTGSFEFDVEAGGSGSGTTCTAGPITTADTNTVVLGAAKHYSSGTWSSETIGGVAATVPAYSPETTIFSKSFYRLLTGTISSASSSITRSASNSWAAGILSLKEASAGGGTESAAASGAGAGTATGSGASTAASDANAAGASTATGRGASTAAAAASSAGASTATAAGAQVLAAAASSAGTGTATAAGVALSIEAAAANAAGTSTATATTESTAAADVSAAGAGTATATAEATAEAVANAAGTSTAQAVSEAGNVEAGAGSAAGTSTASATTESIAAAAANAAGAGTASAEADAIIAPSVASGAASAAGSSTAIAVGRDANAQEATDHGGAIRKLNKQRRREMRERMDRQAAFLFMAAVPVITGADHGQLH